MSTTIPREFFMRDPATAARELIGCTLVWGKCTGIIVETEAYSATGDEACHTWTRPSARAFVAASPPGAAYVYFNYGMYWMLNVLIKGGTADGFVLFRAIEPQTGASAMHRRRLAAQTRPRRPLTPRELCSGPGKLAQALGVTGRDHGRDFCAGGTIAFLPPREPAAVTTCTRIGISRAQHLPWRFLLKDSPFVSTPPKARKPGR